MQKVTVSQKASERKRNRYMPKKKGLQAPKRNSPVHLPRDAKTEPTFLYLLLVESARACWVPNLAVCCVSPTDSSFC